MCRSPVVRGAKKKRVTSIRSCLYHVKVFFSEEGDAMMIYPSALCALEFFGENGK